MLADDIKKRMLGALKAGKTVEKEILRVALAEIQTADARGAEPSDANATAILRKLIKSNEETLGHAKDPEQRSTLEQEIAILRSLLPATLGVDQIVEALAEVRDALRAAANDGQATGIAMKRLKADGAEVNGKDVTEAVKRIRA
jgi:uncharacterized protein YqeY